MKKRTVVIKPGSRRLKLPYPRDYSLRVFYGPGHNPAIDRALERIVGCARTSSGCCTFGRRERDLEWNFGNKRIALTAANRIIKRVALPDGQLLVSWRGKANKMRVKGLVAWVRRGVIGARQRIRRVEVEVWQEAPTKILSVGFRPTAKATPARHKAGAGPACPPIEGREP